MAPLRPALTLCCLLALCATALAAPEALTASGDLDGDGKPDSAVVALYDPEATPEWALSVNDSQRALLGVAVIGVSIVDLDPGDGVREVAVESEGLPGRTVSDYFRYDGTTIERVYWIGDTDLDGDGNADPVALTCPAELLEADGVPVEAGGQFTLRIGEASTEGELFSMVNGVESVDLDFTDMLTELQVFTYGPSDDLESVYYGYEGGRIHEIGHLEGGTTEDHYGEVETASYCHTEGWTWHRRFALTEGRTFEPVEEKLYTVGEELTTPEALTVYTTDKCSKELATLPAGSDVLVVACDCRDGWRGAEEGAWRYIVVLPDGRPGWIKSPLVGLPMAD
jgi:hypothetical protein